MKRIISLLVFLLAAVVSHAENSFTADAVSIQPGEEKTIAVTLTSEDLSKSAAIDITLPEGLSFVGNDGSVTFTSRADGMSNKSGKVQNSGALRVGLAFGSIAAGSGELFSFKVKADENATLGAYKMKFTKTSLTNSANTKVSIPEKEIDVTLYKLYKVEVTANTAVMGSVSGGGNAVVSGTSTTVTATANEGYSFVNWTENSEVVSTESSFSFDVTGNRNLTANFKANQYTSTFVLGNGQDNVVKMQDYNTELSAPENLVKTGYTFNGWTPTVPATVPVGNQTYTAQWQINQYTMTFVLGNGQNDIVKTQDYDTNLEAPADPQREGYTFIGWDAEIPVKIPAESKTFTAQWQVNQYKMTFVLGNGQDNVVKTQDYGTTLEAPANLVKTGYTFTGWDAEVPGTVPAGDKTFTAQWQINQYTMTFVLGNGQDDIVKTQDYDTDLEAPAAPQREGYTFMGWDAEIPTKIPADNKTFTAQWQVNQYKMTFVLGNGQDNVVKTQDYGTTLEAPANLVKTGYTFTGWDAEVPGTVPAGDKTFTAQWQINQYTMTFVLGNGQDDIVKTQDYDTALEAPAAPQREGYTFTGWDAEIPANIPAENKTFTAQWQVNKYKVTFIVDGQTVKETEVEYGAVIEKPTDPQKDTYTFIGWSPEVPATMPASNQTFTAQFALNPYTMTFVLGNGEANIVKTQECGSELTAPADPQREGYTFTGWSPAVPATIPAGDQTFTAQWQINQYKMTFVLGNGEDDVVKTQDYGTALEAPANLMKTGYTFTGWDVEVPAAVPAGDKTFTAQWQVNQYAMTFVLGNGQDDIVKTQDYDTALEAPADPQREGYTFTGWDAEIPAKIPAENKTFTAQWQVNKYKVTFIVDGQTVKEAEVEYGAAIEKPADPQKDTYTFIGWTPEVPATMPAGDQTFTAQFALNPYTMTFVLGNGEANIVKTQECGSELTAPADPQREGYTFTGWSPEVPATVPEGDKTFTAQWQVNQYAIIYMVNGQEWARDLVDFGTAITLREYTPGADETFGGWTFEGGESFEVMPAHDVTVIATITTSIENALKNTDFVSVYDIRGRMIRRDVLVNELRKVLRAGVYVINGRKVAINPIR